MVNVILMVYQILMGVSNFNKFDKTDKVKKVKKFQIGHFGIYWKVRRPLRHYGTVSSSIECLWAHICIRRLAINKSFFLDSRMTFYWFRCVGFFLHWNVTCLLISGYEASLIGYLVYKNFLKAIKPRNRNFKTIKYVLELKLL